MVAEARVLILEVAVEVFVYAASRVFHARHHAVRVLLPVEDMHVFGEVVEHREVVLDYNHALLFRQRLERARHGQALADVEVCRRLVEIVKVRFPAIRGCDCQPLQLAARKLVRFLVEYLLQFEQLRSLAGKLPLVVLREKLGCLAAEQFGYLVNVLGLERHLQLPVHYGAEIILQLGRKPAHYLLRGELFPEFGEVRRNLGGHQLYRRAFPYPVLADEPDHAVLRKRQPVQAEGVDVVLVNGVREFFREVDDCDAVHGAFFRAYAAARAKLLGNDWKAVAIDDHRLVAHAHARADLLADVAALFLDALFPVHYGYPHFSEIAHIYQATICRKQFYSFPRAEAKRKCPFFWLFFPQFRYVLLYAFRLPIV